MSNLIENIREYVMKCPLLSGDRVNVDYVGADMVYSVDPLPCDPVLQKYTDGGAKKQFQFAFTSQEEYDQDTRINIENSGFYQAFEEWLEEMTFKEEFPNLGVGKIPVKLETLNSGYLYDVNGVNAKYRIECRLIYVQEV